MAARIPEVGGKTRITGRVARDQRILGERRARAVLILPHPRDLRVEIRIEISDRVEALEGCRFYAGIRRVGPRLVVDLVADFGVERRILILQVRFVQRAQFESRQRVVGIDRRLDVLTARRRQMRRRRRTAVERRRVEVRSADREGRLSELVIAVQADARRERLLVGLSGAAGLSGRVLARKIIGANEAAVGERVGTTRGRGACLRHDRWFDRCCRCFRRCQGRCSQHDRRCGHADA